MAQTTGNGGGHPQGLEHSNRTLSGFPEGEIDFFRATLHRDIPAGTVANQITGTASIDPVWILFDDIRRRPIPLQYLVYIHGDVNSNGEYP